MDDPDHGNQTYLLTCDLAEKIGYLSYNDIRVPGTNATLFQDLQVDLSKKLQEALPTNVTVQTIEMGQLAQDVLSEAHTVCRDENLIVSTCPEIAYSARGMTLQVNRLVDFDGNSIGLGPRPGNLFMREQIATIRSRVHEEPVVIVEDGMFHGETMEYIIGKLNKYGVKVSAVVVGFTFPESQPVIDRLSDQGVKFISIEEFSNLLDWVPDHDFFPFVPSNGKVVGLSVKGENLPFYTHDQASYSIPYLYGFCPMKEWTSLEEEPAKRFTTFCIHAGIHLFEELESMNGRRIMIADLIHAKQRVSIPVAVSQTGLPGPNTRVIEYLSECL